MDASTSISAKRSKLALYRVGLQRAKERGNLDEAKKYLACMVAIKKEIKEISQLTAQA